MVIKSRCHSFKIFGFNILIWKQETQKKFSGGGVVSGSCKIIKYNNYIALAMPNGELIPHQTDLIVESNLNEAATATIKLYVSI